MNHSKFHAGIPLRFKRSPWNGRQGGLRPGGKLPQDAPLPGNRKLSKMNPSNIMQLPGIARVQRRYFTPSDRPRCA